MSDHLGAFQAKAHSRSGAAPNLPDGVIVSRVKSRFSGWFRAPIARARRVVSLVAVLAPRELRIRYRNSRLDLAWAVLSPAAILVVYGLVLTQSFSVTGTCGTYLASAWAGLVIWSFFAAGVALGVTSIISASDLVSKVYFPKESLPLASVVSSVGELGVGTAILFAVAIVGGSHADPAWPAAVFPIAVAAIWTAVIALLVAVCAVFIRDVVHLVQLLLRVGFFATPVMYESRFLPSQLRWTAHTNPLGVSIDGLRKVVLCGELPDMGVLAVHLVVGTLCLLALVGYTARIEPRIVDAV